MAAGREQGSPGGDQVMSRLQELTDEQKVIGTILFDRARGVEGVIVGSGTIADLAAATAWPGERTFGRSRTARVLRELHAEGIARRAGRDPDGVTRWELDERGWGDSRRQTVGQIDWEV